MSLTTFILSLILTVSLTVAIIRAIDLSTLKRRNENMNQTWDRIEASVDLMLEENIVSQRHLKAAKEFILELKDFHKGKLDEELVGDLGAVIDKFEGDWEKFLPVWETYLERVDNYLWE